MPRWLKLDASKRCVVGTFVQTPSARVAEVLCGLEFDFLCIEAEHSNFPPATQMSFVAAAEAADRACIIRVAGNDEIVIAQALDAGAAGVLIPRIEDAAAAARAVAAARFPPDGKRGVGPGRASRHGRLLARYIEEADQHLLVMLQLETKQGVENLDEILAISGFDVLFVGPGDLAMSYRNARGEGLPDVQEIISDVVMRAQRAGRRTGIYASSVEDAKRWIESGVDVVIVSSDFAFLLEGAQRTLFGLQRDSGTDWKLIV